MRKSIALELATLLILALAACGGDSASPQQPSTPGSQPSNDPGSNTPAPADKVTLTFAMMAFANEIDGWTAMIDEANKILASKNIEIEIMLVPGTGWPEYYQKVITQMAGGQSPDLGRIAESFMPTLIDKEQVVDLTSYLSNDFEMSQYYESTFRNAAYQNGKYYGIPSGLYNYVMYYNKDLFDAAGIAYPSTDWNNAISFSAVRSAAQTLTSGEGAEKVYGFSAGPYLAALGMFSTSIGGNNIFDANGNPSVNDAPTKRVIQWFDDMLRTDYSMPRPTDTAVMGAFEMFMSGRVAMVMDGTWWLGALGAIDGFEVGISAVPAGDGGTAFTSQFVDSFVIYSGTKHEKEAWEALKALTSVQAFEVLSQTGVGGIPPAQAVANRVIDENIGDSVDAASKKAAMDALNHTLGVPYNEFYQEADQKVNSTMDEWLLGRITSDQHADNIQQILLDYAAR